MEVEKKDNVLEFLDIIFKDTRIKKLLKENAYYPGLAEVAFLLNLQIKNYYLNEGSSLQSFIKRKQTDFNYKMEMAAEAILKNDYQQ